MSGSLHQISFQTTSTDNAATLVVPPGLGSSNELEIVVYVIDTNFLATRKSIVLTVQPKDVGTKEALQELQQAFNNVYIAALLAQDVDTGLNALKVGHAARTCTVPQ